MEICSLWKKSRCHNEKCTYLSVQINEYTFSFLLFFSLAYQIYVSLCVVYSFYTQTRRRWSENRYENFNGILLCGQLFCLWKHILHMYLCMYDVCVWYDGIEKNSTVQFKQECLHKTDEWILKKSNNKQHVPIHTPTLKIYDFRSKLLLLRGWQRRQKHSSNIKHCPLYIIFFMLCLIFS